MSILATEMLRTLLLGGSADEARELGASLAGSAPSIAVEHAADVDFALTRVQEGTADVVILMLPGGIDVDESASAFAEIRRIRDAAAHVPVLVLARADDESSAVRAMHEGAQDYLVKDEINERALVRALRYAVERKRAEENARRLLIEHTRRVQAEASARRAMFLAEAGSRLASVLDIDEMPRAIVNLAVPVLADACFIDLLGDSGGIERVASASTRAESARIAETLLRVKGDEASPIDSARGSPVERALRTGQPALVSDVNGERLESISPDPEQALALRALGVRSLMTLPLLARGRTLGAITFVSAESDHAYGPDDLAFAWALADRAALAMDNAKLFRAREETLSVVSHDLRNPLNVITVGLASLKRGVPEERRTLFLEKIRRAADRMNRLIEDLLDVTRLETGSLTLERQAHAVSSIVSDALDLLKPLAEEKSIRFGSEMPEALPSILVDRDRVLQILGNLIGNAVKFTPSGGRITVSVKDDGDEIRFAVMDTGPGIQKGDEARIFDRYFQAKRTDRKGGSGLGLTIAKGLVQAHGGRIWVESEPGNGATFYFVVPTAPHVVEHAREDESDAHAREEPKSAAFGRA